MVTAMMIGAQFYLYKKVEWNYLTIQFSKSFVPEQSCGKMGPRIRELELFVHKASAKLQKSLTDIDCEKSRLVERNRD
jgi:hypothetical protein